MQNRIRYTEFRPDGIFGQFYFDGAVQPFMVFATHSFAKTEGDLTTYHPIVQPGTYTCVRGMHMLEDAVPFETFEITGVLGHHGLLFHPGNYSWSQSEGCNLVGEEIVPYGEHEMVTNSAKTFRSWMARLEGIDKFDLVVE